MLIACRAYGLRPIDGPFGDFADADGYLSAAKRAAVLGKGAVALEGRLIDVASIRMAEVLLTKANAIAGP
jgi:malyl-CoA/(S)-citramalyl-CoA lyase